MSAKENWAAKQKRRQKMAKLDKAEWPKTAQELEKVLQGVKYGWVDNDYRHHSDVDENYSEKYRLQAPEELKKSKLGVCWDQVELERSLLPTDIERKTIFLVYYGTKECPTHTVLLFEEDGKVYWYEHAWERYRGVYEYQDFDAAIADIARKWLEYEAEQFGGDLDTDQFAIYEYEAPRPGTGTNEFYKWAEAGKRLK